MESKPHALPCSIGGHVGFALCPGRWLCQRAQVNHFWGWGGVGKDRGRVIASWASWASLIGPTDNFPRHRTDLKPCVTRVHSIPGCAGNGGGGVWVCWLVLCGACSTSNLSCCVHAQGAHWEEGPFAHVLGSTTSTTHILPCVQANWPGCSKSAAYPRPGSGVVRAKKKHPSKKQPAPPTCRSLPESPAPGTYGVPHHREPFCHKHTQRYYSGGLTFFSFRRLTYT